MWMMLAGLFRFRAHQLTQARMCKTKAGKPSKIKPGKMKAEQPKKSLPPCPPSYDDLPDPIGSWESHYNANQMKYNIQLGASVLFLIGTIAVAKVGGLFQLNYNPPDKPGARVC